MFYPVWVQLYRFIPIGSVTPALILHECFCWQLLGIGGREGNIISLFQEEHSKVLEQLQVFTFFPENPPPAKKPFERKTIERQSARKTVPSPVSNSTLYSAQMALNITLSLYGFLIWRCLSSCVSSPRPNTSHRQMNIGRCYWLVTHQKTSFRQTATSMLLRIWMCVSRRGTLLVLLNNKTRWAAITDGW